MSLMETVIKRAENLNPYYFKLCCTMYKCIVCEAL